MRRYGKYLLGALFTAVYFLLFCLLLGRLFRNGLSPALDLLALACLAIALIASVGAAEYTVKKLGEKFGKK